MLKKIMYREIQLMPPKSDVVFKALLGDEKDIVPRSANKIESIGLL